MKYEVYTDGACSRNPGPGGYCYLLIPEGGNILKGSGGEKCTTNNRMELKAIVNALHTIVDNSPLKYEINIYTDSAYCFNPINQNWLECWQKADWKTKSGTEVKNKDLWMQMYYYLHNSKLTIKLKKVKGHSGNKYNEMADKIAKEAVERFK